MSKNDHEKLAEFAKIGGTIARDTIISYWKHGMRIIRDQHLDDNGGYLE